MFWKIVLLILLAFGVKEGYTYTANYMAAGNNLASVPYGKQIIIQRGIEGLTLRQYYEPASELALKLEPTPESRKRAAGMSCTSLYTPGRETEMPYGRTGFISGKPGRSDDYVRVEVNIGQPECMVEFSLSRVEAGKLFREKAGQ